MDEEIYAKGLENGASKKKLEDDFFWWAGSQCKNRSSPRSMWGKIKSTMENQKGFFDMRKCLKPNMTSSGYLLMMEVKKKIGRGSSDPTWRVCCNMLWIPREANGAIFNGILLWISKIWQKWPELEWNSEATKRKNKAR